MNVVVVFNFSSVTFVNLLQKCDKDRFVELGAWVDVETSHNVHGQDRKRRFSTDLFYKSMDVKIHLADILKQMVIISNNFVDCTVRWSSRNCIKARIAIRTDKE
jgi:hypothetical protein